MQNLCSGREYCTGEIYAKASKLSEGDVDVADAVLESLKADKFVDDLRYASAFARDKSALSGWGRSKISYALKFKGIDGETIALALQEIDTEAAGKKLDGVLAAKYRTLSGDPQRKLKLIRFALGRGYSYHEVKAAISRIAGGGEELI